MFLRNKKTGEVIEWDKNLTYKLDREYTSLKELCENYEDCEGPVYYYFIQDDGRIGCDAVESYNYKSKVVEERKSIGNYFEAREEAEKAFAWLKARKVLFDDAKGFKPDWRDTEQRKWSVCYDCVEDEDEEELYSDFNDVVNDTPGPYFATKGDADLSIAVHRKEWLTYLGVEE